MGLNPVAVLLSCEQLYKICSQLNEGQEHLFNFLMQHMLQCKLGEESNGLVPKPYRILLSGGAVVWKSFLVTTIIRYLKSLLRYPNQNLDQPSLLVTASTGKAATGVDGITVYSTFHLPVKWGLKSYGYKKPSDEILHILRSKHQHLKDNRWEVPTIGRETFKH